MTHRSVLLALLALAALTGCATSEVARIAKANDEHVYGLWTGKQGVELVTRECPRPVWDTHTGGWTTPVPCAEVPGTRDPHDTEFWKFELYRVGQVRIAYGLIPVSPKYKSWSVRSGRRRGQPRAVRALSRAVRQAEGGGGQRWGVLD